MAAASQLAADGLLAMDYLFLWESDGATVICLCSGFLVNIREHGKAPLLLCRSIPEYFGLGEAVAQLPSR